MRRGIIEEGNEERGRGKTSNAKRKPTGDER
jgi:hypothetical protein